MLGNGDRRAYAMGKCIAEFLMCLFISEFKLSGGLPESSRAYRRL